MQKKNVTAGRGDVDWSVYGWLENTIYCGTFHVTNDETLRVVSHDFLFIQ